jgi:DNA-binding CsgD family transcriptional regulator
LRRLPRRSRGARTKCCRAPAEHPPRVRLLEGLAALFANLGRRRPVLVFLDDAHLADASTWEALGYLARNIPDARMLVLVAVRPVELDEHTAAIDVILGLEQEALLTRLQVRPLGHHDLGHLAEGVVGERPPGALVDWLVERSWGNPLFAIGLLQALVEEGADLAAPRLRSLPEELALSEDRALMSLEQLVRVRLVTETERGRELSYEIAHPLVQEAVYQHLGGVRRRRLHRRIGRVLFASGQLGEAAQHFARSADVGDQEAIRALSDAVREVERRGAYRESLAILATLVELVPAGDERWLQVLYALSWRAEWVVDHRADGYATLGVMSMRAIDSLLTGPSEAAPRAAVKFRLANFLGWGTGELDEAERACAEAHALFEQGGDPASALLAENELAWISGLRGDYAQMAMHGLRVARAAELARERFAALQAWHVCGFAAFVRGRFFEADAALRRSNQIAIEEGRTYRTTVGLTMRACALAVSGRPDEAVALVVEAKMLDPAWRDSLLPEWEVLIHWFAGSFRMALACAEEAAARAVGELSRRRALGVVFAALSAVEAGQLPRARTDLERVRCAFGGRDWQFFSHLAGHVDALLAWQAGAGAEAIASLRETATRVLATGAEPFAAIVLVDLAEAASEYGDVVTAREAAAQLEQIARHVNRPLYGALAAIGAAAAGDAEAARVAVELLSTSNCKAFYARALDRFGRSVVDTDRRKAVEALERAAVTFDRCGAAWRRDRAREALRRMGTRGRRVAATVLGASSLSPRERQVARLAADGHTIRDIADQLVIGERTVETHLAHAYAKLGVRSKTELMRRAGELPLNP